MEKRELSYTVGRNVNWYIHYREQYWRFLKKLKLELLYDPVIPLLEKMKTLIQKDTGNRIFTAALFTIAKRRK